MRDWCATRAVATLMGLLFVTACRTKGDGETLFGGDDGDTTIDHGADDAMPEQTFDVLVHDTDGPACSEGVQCDECVPLAHTPCDANTADPFQAMGINCPGEPAFMTSSDGNPAAMGVRSSFGGTQEWNPREGNMYAVLGSGYVWELDDETPPFDLNSIPTYCNDDLGSQYDKGSSLPPPILVNDVDGDCEENPRYLGTGDCSNTIAAQFQQGGTAHDYTELRIVAEVPPTNNSFSYDFAFFSTEYPTFFGSSYNDMYIGWLESESWTGNISFDELGQPISLNAGFLDFRDDDGNLPELAGTCMRQHAGTKWLSTTAPVTPGEEITLVFAIFDLADSSLDSYVFLDNFHWGCDGTESPKTVPVG